MYTSDYIFKDGLYYYKTLFGLSVCSVLDYEYSGTIVIPSSVTFESETYDVICIDCNTFNNCKNLTCITIPESVKSIGSYVFTNCIGLTSITIPESVKSIGSYTFAKCTSLQYVICNGAPARCETNTFGDKVYEKAKLLYPSEYDSIYTTSDVWNKFSTKEATEKLTINNIENQNVSIVNKTIYCSESFKLYNTLGQNVTEYNGNLKQGVYIVVTEHGSQKVIVQ